VLSQSPQSGACLRTLTPSALAGAGYKCLNPLKAGPAFGPRPRKGSFGAEFVSIPSKRGLPSDSPKPLYSRQRGSSQSPQSGACLRTHSPASRGR